MTEVLKCPSCGAFTIQKVDDPEEIKSGSLVLGVRCSYFCKVCGKPFEVELMINKRPKYIKGDYESW